MYSRGTGREPYACVWAVTASTGAMGVVTAVLDVADWATIAHRPFAAGVLVASVVEGSALREDGNAGANGDPKRHGDTAHVVKCTALIANITSRLTRLPQASGSREHPRLGGWWLFRQPPPRRLKHWP